MADFTVDYNDERFNKVETEKNNAITETKNTYDQMINNSDSHYQDLINASKDYANKQTELQNAQTNLTVEEINQQKEKAEKNYIKEQKGAYADYQKSTNSYGVNAENLASSGLNKTGYSETTRTNAYNTYQNRYMSARETYNDAILNYDNAIKEARLANNSTLAEIAYNALKEQLELSLEGFQYKNTLIQTKLDAINTQEDRYYTRYQDVLNQINTENQLRAEQEQFEKQLQWEKEQAAQEQANWEKEYALSLASLRKSSSGGSSRSSSSSSSGGAASLTNNGYEVNTAYYQGNKNADCQYGTFSNGYQPNNVNGDKLSKTGDTLTFTTQTLSGQPMTVTQNIWKTSDGSKYYWEGRQNKYIKIS